MPTTIIVEGPSERTPLLPAPTQQSHVNIASPSPNRTVQVQIIPGASIENANDILYRPLVSILTFPRTYLGFLLLFSLSIGISVYATMSSDILRTPTLPFTSIYSTYGMFETCTFLNEKTSSCHPFPSNECHVPFPPDPKKSVTFCQSWLIARYIQFSALGFAVIGWMGWIILMLNPFKLSGLSPVLWCTGFHALLQVCNTVIFNRLTDTPIFGNGGSYGNAFFALQTSWVMDVFLIGMLVTYLCMKSSMQYALPYATVTTVQEDAFVSETRDDGPAPPSYDQRVEEAIASSSTQLPGK